MSDRDERNEFTTTREKFAEAQQEFKDYTEEFTAEVQDERKDMIVSRDEFAGTQREEAAKSADSGSLTGIHWGAILLAAITGVVHFSLYMTEGFPLYLLGGLGFFGGISLLITRPDYRRYCYLAGIPYTLTVIAGWLARGMPHFQFGAFNSAVEVLLIVFLVYLIETDTGEETQENMVECRVCGEYFPVISKPHLLSHGMSIQEYQEKYGETVPLRPDDKS